MDYQTLKDVFSQHERTNPATHLSALITFSSIGPNRKESLSERSRTYAISSNNKAFQPYMGGNSILGSCLDGTAPLIRLDRCMAAEHGGADDWIVEDCCLLGYLLTHVNERTIYKPALFYSRLDAVEAMLKMLCEEGNLEYDLVLRDYLAQDSKISDSYFAAGKNYAWLDAGSNGNWDWTIQPICIYSPEYIVVGGLLDDQEGL